MQKVEETDNRTTRRRTTGQAGRMKMEDGRWKMGGGRGQQDYKTTDYGTVGGMKNAEG